MREAVKLRIQAERAALPPRWVRSTRLEEPTALKVFIDVPSVFAFAERINPSYLRPGWAAAQWGAR